MRAFLRMFVIALAAIVANGGSPTLAATYTWSGGSTGTWGTNATNWTGASGTPWDGVTGPGNIANFTTANNAAAVPGNVYASQINFSTSTTLSGTGTIRLTTGSLAVSAPSAVATVATAFTGTAPLIKTGSGTLKLSGTNAYSGPTSVNGGTLMFTRPAALYGGGTASWTAANLTAATGATLALSVGGTGEFTANDVATIAALGTGTSGFLDNSLFGFDTTNAASGTFAYTSPLANTNGGATALGVAKTGSGTLVLSAASTYTGTTAIAGGILQVTGGNDRLPTAGTLSFTGSSTTFDLGTSSQTLAAMTFLTPTSGTAGMTISGTGGSLTVNGTANFEVGPGGTVATAGIADTLSMANLSRFAYTNTSGTFRVGLKQGAGNTAAAGTSSIILAQNNSITASTIAVADQLANNNGGGGLLSLGQTNAFNVTSITQANGRSDTVMQFQSGLTNPTLVVRGTDGTSPMGTWLVGSNSQSSSGAKKEFTSSVDLSAGTVDVLLGDLVIGQANANSAARGGTQRSSFTMGSGTLAANSITVGRITITSNTASVVGTSGTFAAYGTLTIATPGAVVSATSVYVAENTFTGTSNGPTSVSGTVNLSAGTLLASTLARGAQTGFATATTKFNWTGGTIGNIAGSDLTVDTLPLSLASGTGTFVASGANTITVNAGSPISGAGTLVKDGSGSLVLQAANPHTGTVRVAAGTLALASGASLASGTISVGSGGVFDVTSQAGGYTVPAGQWIAGSGTVAGGLTVGSGGVITPSAGSGGLSVTGGLTFGPDGNYNWQLLDATGAAGTGWGLVSTDSISFPGLSSASPFHVNLWSLSAAGVSGDTQHFDAAVAGSWRILTSASTISGFDPANFTLTTSATAGSSGFTNALLGGSFSLALSNDSLGIDVRFTPNTPYTWYGNGSTAGGGGAWSSGGITWSSGSAMTAWNPSKGALFGTSGGTVTINSPQSVGYGLTFTADGYQLTGSDLTLTGNQTANTVTVGNGLTATLSTAVSASSGMTKSGAGTLVLAGDAAAGGGVSLLMGTLAIGAGGTSGSLAGDLATSANTAVVFNRADASTYAGALSGPAGIRTAGTGAITLSGANSYSGGTVLAGGTAVLGSSTALGSGTISFVGGAIQYTSAAATDYSSQISTGTGQAFVIDTADQSVSFATGLAGAGNTLTKRGVGTLSLAGTGSYTGATRIVGGTLALAGGNAIAASTLDMNAADAGVLTFTDSSTSTYQVGGLQGSRGIDLGSNTLAIGGNDQSTTYSGTFSGAGGLTKSGTGTLSLSAANVYSGSTSIAAGTLRLTGGNNRLPTAGLMTFTGSNTTLDVTTTSQTVDSMTFLTPTTGTAAVAITGAGSLTVNGTSNFEVGAGPGTVAKVGVAESLSMANLGSFTYTNPTGTFRVGLKQGSGNTAIAGTSSIVLAQSNAITAATIGLGDVGANNNGGSAVLELGQANTFNVANITMSPGRSNSVMQFRSGLTSPTLVIRGLDGVSPATAWAAGGNTNFGTAKFASSVDLSGGTTDAQVTTLTIAVANAATTGRGGTIQSSFTMGSGTLATDSITVGKITGNQGVNNPFTAYGALTIANPAALVTATSVFVAENSIIDSGTVLKTVSGTINLSAGTLLAGTLARGAQTGNSDVVVSTAFLWTGGTVGNLAGSDLAVDTLPLTLSSGTGTFLASGSQTITVSASSPISGTGSLVKAGSGTLVLLASSSFTGTTRVTAGTLSLGDAAALAGSTLDLSGSDAGTLALPLGGVTYTLGGLQGSKSVNLGSNSLSVGGNGQSTTYSGVLSGTGSLTKTGAGTTTLAGANTISGPTTVEAGTLQLANGAALASSRIVPLAGGTVSLAPYLQTTVGGLAPNAGGLVNLTNGLVTVASGLSATDLVTAIVAGRADGTWTGTSGITSSVAASDVAVSIPRAVGWLDNGDGSVTAAFAAPGDTNLDWQVDVLDASNFLSFGKFDSGLAATWMEGDFNYDGVVDVLDAADFFGTGLYDAGNYNTPPGASGIAAVPEPVATGIVALAIAGIAAVANLSRSRRSSHRRYH